MSIKIDFEHLLKEYMREGINIFAGAGFSILPNSKGESLPLGSELVNLLCEHFNYNNEYNFSLQRLIDVLKLTVGESTIREYLTSLFTIKEYNPLYNNLLKIKIKNFITTNIDNLFRLIVDNSTTDFINDVLEEGEVISNNKIGYIPLHGDVSKNNFDYLFTSAELSQAAKINPTYFSQLQSTISKHPTIFIGYSFNDSAVFETLLNANITPSKTWIVIKPGTNSAGDIAYYKAKGYNLIIGDTKSFLVWLNDFAPSTTNEQPATASTLSVPNVASLPSISNASFYQEANTNWYSIIQKHPAHTHFFNEVCNSILKEKLLIVTGIQFSGKTTLAMQVAKSFASKAYFVSQLTSIAQSEYILRNVSSNSIILVDDCSGNMLAFLNLVQKSKNKVIGFSENYAFEVSKHLLTLPYKVLDISDLTAQDYLEIYDKVPIQIRKTIQSDIPQHLTMTECVHLCVRNVITKQKINKLLSKLFSNDKDCFMLMGLASYLTSNKSTISMDILVSFFERYNYVQIYDLIKRLQGYLQEANLDNNLTVYNQDYFVVRSHLFSTLSSDCLMDYYCKEYATIIEKFIKNVHYSKIVDLKIFVRTAFDAKRFNKIFKNDANEIYNFIYEYYDCGYNNIYILQQWAQLNGLQKNFTRAFELIDKARTEGKRNFSIENTYACLLFDNNVDKGKSAIGLLNESMDILKNCYINDKRKDSHAKAFGRYAIILYKKYRNSEYIFLAKTWIEEVINDNTRTDHELEIIARELRLIS